ncbi:MAG TPA: MOSC domain-containing protein, partial [Thioploca sp.]|nr:MOSC domain-containing protein [Thioploca sp.]
MPTITHLYRYPIKGMSPEALQRVSLQAGEAIAL